MALRVPTTSFLSFGKPKIETRVAKKTEVSLSPAVPTSRFVCTNNVVG